MPPAENPRSLAEQAPAEVGEEGMLCPSCERLVPAGSSYCPYCCGEDGRRGAIKRGVFIGGVFGLLAGGLAAAVWSSIVGPEQATGELVLAITLACAAVCSVLGAIHHRKG